MVGTLTIAPHAEQGIVSRKSASSWRRAATRLMRSGGESRPVGIRGWGEAPARNRGDDRVAPDQLDQGEVPMQPRPGPALVVVQPKLLLGVLVEALHRPPPVGYAHHVGQRELVQPPGEKPLRLTAR